MKGQAAGKREDPKKGENKRKDAKDKSVPSQLAKHREDNPKPKEGVKPGTTVPNPELWTTVLGRKERKEGKKAKAKLAETTKDAKKPPTGEKPLSKRRTRRRQPRSAAVTVTCPPGQYAEIMAVAKSSIKLEDLGIGEIRPRRAVTGALILEIPGPQGAIKASALKNRMDEVVGSREGVRIGLPSKKADLRIKDLMDTTETTEIRDAIARQGECSPEEIRIGKIRQTTYGTGTVWAQCPIPAANKLVSSGRIRIGWTSSRVEMLPARQLQCFRCLERGHVQANCVNGVDRSDACYRCGQTGHRAAECVEKPSCMLCLAAGRPSTHRLGGAACGAPPVKKKRKGGKKGSGVPAAVPTNSRTKTSRPATRDGPTPMDVTPALEGNRNREGVERMDTEAESPPPPPLPQRTTRSMTRGEGGEEPDVASNIHSSKC